MRSFPQHWRDDRYLMERTCPHGIGHPDPDHLESLAYAPWAGGNIVVSTEEQEEFIWGQGVHGCDGCCGPAPSEAEVDTTYPTIAPVDIQVWPPADDDDEYGTADDCPCGGIWGDRTCSGEARPASTFVPTDGLPSQGTFRYDGPAPGWRR